MITSLFALCHPRDNRVNKHGISTIATCNWQHGYNRGPTYDKVAVLKLSNLIDL